MLMATEASGHTVIERGGVGITVEVHRMLLEQVRPHDHAHVREGEERNSSSSSIAISGRWGCLPFITPISSIWAGIDVPHQDKGVVQVPAAMASRVREPARRRRYR